MNKSSIIIVFLIILILFVVFIDSNFTRLEIHDFKAPSYKAGDFTLCLIGSVHGNEPVGTKALNDLLSSKVLDISNTSYSIVILSDEENIFVTVNKYSHKEYLLTYDKFPIEENIKIDSVIDKIIDNILSSLS